MNLKGLELFSKRVPNAQEAKIVDSFMTESDDRQVRGDSTILKDGMTTSHDEFSEMCQLAILIFHNFFCLERNVVTMMH